MLLPLTIKYWTDASTSVEKEIAVNPESILRLEPQDDGTCLMWCERMNSPYIVKETIDNIMGAVNVLTFGLEDNECKPADLDTE